MIMDQQTKAEVIFTVSAALTFFVIQSSVVLLATHIRDRVLVVMSTILPTAIFVLSQQGGEVFVGMPKHWIEKVSTRNVQATIVVHGIVFAIVSYVLLSIIITFVARSIHTITFDIFLAVLLGGVPSCVAIISVLYYAWMLIASRWSNRSRSEDQ